MKFLTKTAYMFWLKSFFAPLLYLLLIKQVLDRWEEEMVLCKIEFGC